ncbi:hypothetical protein HOD61_00520 [archaeon]|jgi:archaeal flagellar protein FlaJ|nr:hypothetical protein [archaeon]
MYEDIKHVAERILNTSKEAEKYDSEKKELISKHANKEDIEEYNEKIKNLLKQIKNDLPIIYNEVKKTPVLDSKNNISQQESTGSSFGTKLSFSEKRKLLSELNISEDDLKKFAKIHKSPKKEVENKDFTVYKSTKYAKLSNTMVERFSFSLMKKKPDLFKPLFGAMNSANLKVFSRSYVDIILFSAILALPITMLVLFLITSNPIISILSGIVAMPVVAILIYMYPFSIVNTRRREIKRELVFAIIHMAAISGSGVKPSKIFKLLIESKEYPELETEFKRILNYTNLFGYSLSTSLRAVAETTPSPEFKELLHGMTSTIETGGSLNDYLSNKADETMGRFNLDQKKYLETIATYSDVYTGLLIAGPLLFIVTLAILESISPDLGGIAISTLASLGVFVMMPLLNIIFMLFLEMGKSEI